MHHTLTHILNWTNRIRGQLDHERRQPRASRFQARTAPYTLIAAQINSGPMVPRSPVAAAGLVRLRASLKRWRRPVARAAYGRA
jgi:hypothetical protein